MSRRSVGVASSRRSILSADYSAHGEDGDDDERSVAVQIGLGDVADDSEASPTTKSRKSRISSARQRHPLCILAQKFVAEMVGTFFLIVTIGLSAGQGEALAPIAIAASVWCAKYCFGHVSGAHINPSVTFGAYIRGSMPILDSLVYVAGQFAGAFIGAVVSNADLHSAIDCVKNSTNTTNACGSGFPNVNPEYRDNLGVPMSMEAVFTFMLVAVGLNCQATKKVEGNEYYGFAIGSVILVGVVAVGDISGGAFNPAVGTSLPVVAGDTQYIWIYWCGPLLGAFFAGILFYVTSDPAEYTTRPHQGCVFYGQIRCCCSKDRPNDLQDDPLVEMSNLSMTSLRDVQ